MPGHDSGTTSFFGPLLSNIVISFLLTNMLFIKTFPSQSDFTLYF